MPIEHQIWRDCFGDKPIGSLIGGELCAGNGEAITLLDPATEQELCTYRDGGSEHAQQAVEAAQQGAQEWQTFTASQRGRILWTVGQHIRAQADPLALLESRNAGKPIRDARVEVGKVAEMFDYYAGWADKLHGETIPVPTSHLNYTLRQPHGVVAQLTPWNAPIFTAGWQIAPALAAGNAVVLKPSELTPLSSLCLARLAQQAGVPANALNVLAGLGPTAGDTLVRHPALGKVVFVGSPTTGQRIAAAANEALTPCLLELGGKSANIIFADADLKRAAIAAQGAIFAAAGQSCTAGSRLLVQRAVYDEVIERVARGAEQLTLGPPQDPATEVGPIQNAQQYRSIQTRLQAGLANGAELITGGARPDQFTRGYFFAPTVVKTNHQNPLAQEEIFGPVLSVIPFADETEALALANASAFDLAGAVWTNNPARAHRVAAQLRAGTVWINSYRALSVMSPFGGLKGSGYGRSSGYDALLEYTRPKSIWLETADDPPQAFGYAVDIDSRS